MKKSIVIITLVSGAFGYVHPNGYDTDNVNPLLIHTVSTNESTTPQVALNTALHISADRKDFGMVKLLVQAKADVNSRLDDETPLGAAIGTSVLGNFPFGNASCNREKQTDKDKRTAAIVKTLIDGGVRNEVGSTWTGQTPFLCALNYNKPETARLLLEKFGKQVIFEKDNVRQNALHFAAMASNPELVDLVLNGYKEAGAQFTLNYPGKSAPGNIVHVRSGHGGATPYHLARRNDADTAIKFLEAGVPGIDERTALHGLPEVFTHGLANCFGTVRALVSQVPTE